MKIQKLRNGIELVNKLDYINEKLDNIINKTIVTVINIDDRISSKDYEEINRRVLEVVKNELKSMKFEVETEIESQF